MTQSVTRSCNWMRCATAAIQGRLVRDDHAVPKFAITMTIPRSCAPGDHMHGQLCARRGRADTLSLPVSPIIPASILRTHEHATCFWTNRPLHSGRTDEMKIRGNILARRLLGNYHRSGVITRIDHMGDSHRTNGFFRVV